MDFAFREHEDESSFTSEDERWNAVLKRTSHADGRFVYGVWSTRIFCRPTCPSRRPHRKFVQFYDGFKDAIRAGLRPCRRCAPQDVIVQSPDHQRQHHALAVACEEIEQAVLAGRKPPTLPQLSIKTGLSQYYLHRLFRSKIGITPRDYAQSWKHHASSYQLSTPRSLSSSRPLLFPL